MPEKKMYRCKKTSCNKVLFEGLLTEAEVTIKCKCGTFNTFTGEVKKYIYNAPYQDRLDLNKK